MPGDSEITDLLSRWSEGNRESLDALLPLVYGELKKIALSMQHSATLNPTSVVHELYVRLCGMNGWKWESRRHFYGVAAGLMRRIVVDHAREQHAQKRGGGWVREELSPEMGAIQPSPENQIALDRALDELERLDPQKARIAELRYFGGLSTEETAAVLEKSPATVKRDWVFAKLWLYNAITGQPQTPA